MTISATLQTTALAIFVVSAITFSYLAVVAFALLLLGSCLYERETR